MEENKITQEQIDQINEVMEEAKNDSPELKTISELPSNNGVDEHVPEKGESVKALVTIDPVTGEHRVQQVVSDDVEAEDDDERELFEKFDKIERGELHVDLDDSPASIDEFMDAINDKNNAIIKEITRRSKGFDNVSRDTIKKMLEIANRKLKKENFNVYKELPEEVQEMINRYCSTSCAPLNTPNGNHYRNLVAEQLVNEYVSKISFNRIQHDLSSEINSIFKNLEKEVADRAIGYTEERERQYREAIEKIEDPEKKEKVSAIMDAIKEGYDLTELKEFSKKCKIKRYELERPEKIYSDFVRKYKDSSQNVYGIDSAISVLLRNLNKDKNGNAIVSSKGKAVIYYDENKVNAFFIAFAKQIMNYDPENNIIQHAYIYYVLYNAMFTDINVTDNRESSNKYMDNVKEVINNLVERNKNLFDSLK